MKKAFLKIASAFLAAAVMLPLLSVNKDVKAAGATVTSEDIRQYILNSSESVPSGSNGDKAFTMSESTLSNASGIQIIANANSPELVFVGFVSSTNISMQERISITTTTNTVSGNQVLLDYTYNGVSFRMTTKNFDTNYVPGETNLVWNMVGNQSVPGSTLSSARTSATAFLPNFLTRVQEMLNDYGFALCDCGFTYSDYIYPAVTFTAGQWVGTDRGTRNVYTDVSTITLRLGGVSAPDGVTVNYKVYKSLGDDRRLLIYKGNGTTASVTVGQGTAISPDESGWFTAGTYTIEFYDSHGRYIIGASCTVKNTNGPALPPFVPSTGTGVEAFVKRLYTVVLTRDAEADGVSYWSQILNRKMATGGDAAREFLTSDEFTAKGYGDRNYVRILYRLFFNRVCTSDELTYWTNVLNTESRESVTTGFINSNEWQEICAGYGIESGAAVAVDPTASVRAFVTRFYTTCLGRDAEEAGVNYWTEQLVAGNISGRAAAHEFFFGGEFVASNHSDSEFVARLYRTFMNREGSSDEISYWVSNVEAYGRESVFNGFASSDEFASLCNEAGINP